jgi:hypothetical protein
MTTAGTKAAEPIVKESPKDAPTELAVVLLLITICFIIFSGIVTAQFFDLFGADNKMVDELYYTAASFVVIASSLLWILLFFASLVIILELYSGRKPCCSWFKNVAWTVQGTSALLQVTQLMTVLYLLRFDFDDWGHFVLFGNYEKEAHYAVVFIVLPSLVSFYYDASLLYSNKDISPMSKFTMLVCTRLLVLNFVLCCIPLATDTTPDRFSTMAWWMFGSATFFNVVLNLWTIIKYSENVNVQYGQVGSKVDSKVVNSNGSGVQLTSPSLSDSFVSNAPPSYLGHIVCYLLIGLLLLFNTIRCFDVVRDGYMNYIYIASLAVYTLVIAAGFALMEPVCEKTDEAEQEGIQAMEQGHVVQTNRFRGLTQIFEARDSKTNVTDSNYMDYTWRLCTAILSPSILFTLFGLVMQTADKEGLDLANESYVSATVAFVIWMSYALDVRMKQIASHDDENSDNGYCGNHAYASSVLLIVYVALFIQMCVHMTEWQETGNNNIFKMNVLLHSIGFVVVLFNGIAYAYIYIRTYGGCCCFEKMNRKWKVGDSKSHRKAIGFVNGMIVFCFTVAYLLLSNDQKEP